MQREFRGKTDLNTNPNMPQVIFYHYWSFLESIKDIGHDEEVIITIKKARRSRTLKQNSLMHVIINKIAEEVGESPKTIKEIIKMKFIDPKPWKDRQGNEVFNEETGELVTYRPDTSDLNTAEMSALLDKTIKWAESFFGIRIPSKEDLANNHY